MPIYYICIWALFNFLVVNSCFALGVRSKNNIKFSVFTWNIEKGQNPNWIIGIEKYPSDIYLFQEAVTSSSVLVKLNRTLDPTYSYIFNDAWTRSDNHSTGTLSSSHFDLVNYIKLLSVDKEPLVLTPKSMLITDYNLFQCGILRVINIHMINFNIGPAYKRQLNQLTTFIKNYNDPLIIAGDFNTWNVLRNKTLKKWANKLNLEYVNIPRENKILILDHIFYKGPITLDHSKEINIKLSDHRPLQAHFICN